MIILLLEFVGMYTVEHDAIYIVILLYIVLWHLLISMKCDAVYCNNIHLDHYKVVTY